MTLYALDDIEDAVDATRAFLWPFEFGLWAKLALVVFFVGAAGGAGGVNPFQFSGGIQGDVSETPGVSDPTGGLSSIGGTELAVIAAVVAVIVVLGLVFLVVGSVMEFVFVESLRREQVTIRRYWSQHLGRGLRLFGFRLLLAVLTFGGLGLLLVLALWPFLFGNGEISLVLLLSAIPLGFVLMFASGFVHAFTTMFVVPVMMVEDRGVIPAWRRFWPTMTGQWKEYLVYAVMAFVLQGAAGLAVGIVTGIGALVVAIPLAAVGLLGVGLLSVSGIAGWGVIALAIALFVLGVIVIALFVSVPVQTFFHYHALLVLGDTNGTFDLIPERRQAIRTEESAV